MHYYWEFTNWNSPFLYLNIKKLLTTLLSSFLVELSTVENPNSFANVNQNLLFHDTKKMPKAVLQASCIRHVYSLFIGL